tara:strand:- start:1245 stop:1733 length:489 start_codon:yes stop_codon:yes gene_type:complete
MIIENIDINRLKPYQGNPRKIEPEAVMKVAKSIEEYGFQQPIVVDKDYVVIVGHTRLLASKQIGLETVPVKIADISDDLAKAYRIADNRLNLETSWDKDILNVELQELKELNYNLANLGFDKIELDEILFDENDFEPSNIDDQSDLDDEAKRCEHCGQKLPQ